MLVFKNITIFKISNVNPIHCLWLFGILHVMSRCSSSRCLSTIYPFRHLKHWHLRKLLVTILFGDVLYKMVANKIRCTRQFIPNEVTIANVPNLQRVYIQLTCSRLRPHTRPARPITTTNFLQISNLLF